MESEKMNPRELLLKHYSQSAVPTHLIQRKTVETPQTAQDNFEFGDVQYIMISQIFKDDRITPQQREKIAIAVLNGEVEMRPQSSRHESDSFAFSSEEKDEAEVYTRMNRHKFEPIPILEMKGGPKDLQPRHLITDMNWREYTTNGPCEYFIPDRQLPSPVQAANPAEAKERVLFRKQ